MSKMLTRSVAAIGLLFGLLTGGLWLISLTLETFTDLSGIAGILATAPFLLGGFLLWGVAGVVAVWRTGSTESGLLAAVWSALENFGYARARRDLAQIADRYEQTNPELARQLRRLDR